MESKLTESAFQVFVRIKPSPRRSAEPASAGKADTRALGGILHTEGSEVLLLGGSLNIGYRA